MYKLKYEMGKNINGLYFIICRICVVDKGSYFFVDGSSNIARLLRVPPILIGVTIVAFGTSSPEATVSIIATLEGSAGVAVGNVVGSNIFNILFVLGVSSAISPLAVNGKVLIDVVFMIVLTIVLLIFSRTGYKVGKREGLVLAMPYIIYFVHIIIRN
ncbi:hypothetical protein CSV79_12220 [Sporosarcina sp. P13]|nr:hypothetical protein [Sporosarcina sp. P13]PIC63323.1 hypothetical protein CSV79_12220 [Sporosarcina sp. P13]